MSNWEYANVVPTEAWRSAMTVSREIKLIKGTNSYRIAFTPADELNAFKGIKFKKEKIEVSGELEIINSKQIDLAKAELKFNISDIKDKDLSFKLSNSRGDELLFGYEPSTNTFYVDRRKTGKVAFEERFASKVSTAPRTSSTKNLEGTILLDKTSIELFFDNGET